MNKTAIILLSICIILISNFVFFKLNKKLFNKQITKVQRVIHNTNYTAYFLTQFVITVGYLYLIVEKNGSPFDAFIYGFIIYGYSQLINMASFKHWKLHTIIINTLWGSGLFYLTRLFIH